MRPETTRILFTILALIAAIAGGLIDNEAARVSLLGMAGLIIGSVHVPRPGDCPKGVR